MRAITTIGVTAKNNKDLNLLKLKYDLVSKDEVLTILFNVVRKFKPELREEAIKINNRRNI